jgi:hypothetical protein
MLPTNQLRVGDNVLAVEVHQQSGTTPQNADIVFAMSITATTTEPKMADLILWSPSLLPRLEESSFSTTSCEVREGLIQAGRRRLLRFATETRNIGSADLVMGIPAGNPEFVFHACHNHYHFDAFVEYRLVRQEGGHRHIVASGGKPSFALEDTDRWDTVNGLETPRFSSRGESGLQRGWADVYSHVVPGQWIDVTDVPPGRYTLEIELDPNNKIPELSESNNTAIAPVEIPENYRPCSSPPVNDKFANAQRIEAHIATVFGTTQCATRENGEPILPSDSPDRPGGPSVWYKWIAPYTGPVTIDTEGSNFDTVLGLYRGTNIARLTRIAFSDEEGLGSTSRVRTNVVEGTEYIIQVYGFYSFMAGRADSGNLVLNINAARNSHWETAQLLDSYAGVLSGTTKDTPSSPNESSTAWYRWQPTNDLAIQFTVAPPQGVLRYPYGTVTMEAFFDAPSSTSQIAQGETVTFLARRGFIYYIAVHGEKQPPACFQLAWSTAVLLVPNSVAEPPGFRLYAPLKATCTIEFSTDLKNWIAWKRYEDETGASSHRFDPPLEKAGFFRAKLD